MNILGILVQADPAAQTRVAAAMRVLPGVEIHASDALGRFVVTIEEDGSRPATETLVAINNLPGVRNAALTYHHSDSDEAAA